MGFLRTSWKIVSSEWKHKLLYALFSPLNVTRLKFKVFKSQHRKHSTLHLDITYNTQHFTLTWCTTLSTSPWHDLQHSVALHPNMTCNTHHPCHPYIILQNDVYITRNVYIGFLRHVVMPCVLKRWEIDLKEWPWEPFCQGLEPLLGWSRVLGFWH